MSSSGSTLFSCVMVAWTPLMYESIWSKRAFSFALYALPKEKS